MNILTIGATGQYAGLAVPEFKKRGFTVTALVRDKAKAALALSNGADKTVIGNLYDVKSLNEALSGMDGVFHIIPAFQREVEAGLNMVNAATATGIKKFVFSSVYHTSLSLVNHADKRPAEEALYRSGMDYTILQPAMYMQMLSGAFQSAKEHGKIIAPYSKHSKMSYVDYRDVAEAAALAMTDSRLAYGTFELCSHGMLSRVNLAEMIGNTIGKNVEAAELPTDQWTKQVQIPPGELRDGLIAMNKEYDSFGFSGGNDLILKTILGRKPRTVKAFIEELNS